MYTSFTIKNFRCFENLTIEPLVRVNLITGRNNTGKTALLEALWLHSGPNNPDLGVRIAGFRGIPGQDPNRFLHDLFYNFNTDRTIVLSSLVDAATGTRQNLKVNSRPLSFTGVPTPLPNTLTAIPVGSQESDISAASSSEIVLDYTDEFGQQYVSSCWLETYRSQSEYLVNPRPGMPVSNQALVRKRAHMPSRPSSVLLSPRLCTNPDEDLVRFGQAEVEGASSRIVDCLRMVDSRIQRLTTISSTPAPMLYADIGLERLVPIGFMGDGIGRLLSMALAFHNAKDGSILIDEIENGLHYSVLPDIWKNLNTLSQEFNVQVFATTHSYECMVAARDAFKAGENQELRIHRLDRREDQPIKAVTIPFDSLDFILDHGAEIR